MTDKILYRVLCDEYEEVARIFFEIKETGEQIEGSHQIQKWINNLFNENEQLKKIREVALELVEEATQHNLWKLRTFFKEYNKKVMEND